MADPWPTVILYITVCFDLLHVSLIFFCERQTDVMGFSPAHSTPQKGSSSLCVCMWRVCVCFCVLCVCEGCGVYVKGGVCMWRVCVCLCEKEREWERVSVWVLAHNNLLLKHYYCCIAARNYFYYYIIISIVLTQERSFARGGGGRDGWMGGRRDGRLLVIRSISVTSFIW